MLLHGFSSNPSFPTKFKQSNILEASGSKHEAAKIEDNDVLLNAPDTELLEYHNCVETEDALNNLATEPADRGRALELEDIRGSCYRA